MSREGQHTIRRFPPGIPLLPGDFPDRLAAIKEISGLSWEGMAVCIGVDSRQLLKWRRGCWPSGGAMLSLVHLATRLPGGLSTLLKDDLVEVHRRRQDHGAW